MSVFIGRLHSILYGYTGKSRNIWRDGCKWQALARKQISVDYLSLLLATTKGWTQEGFISPFITSFIYSCPCVPGLWFLTPYQPTWQVPSTTDLMGCHFRPQVVMLGWPDRSHPHDNIRTIYHVTKVISDRRRKSARRCELTMCFCWQGAKEGHSFYFDRKYHLMTWTRLALFSFFNRWPSKYIRKRNIGIYDYQQIWLNWVALFVEHGKCDNGLGLVSLPGVDSTGPLRMVR